MQVMAVANLFRGIGIPRLSSLPISHNLIPRVVIVYVCLGAIPILSESTKTRAQVSGMGFIDTASLKIDDVRLVHG